jgi:hypothetical protein
MHNVVLSAITTHCITICSLEYYIARRPVGSAVPELWETDEILSVIVGVGKGGDKPGV